MTSSIVVGSRTEMVGSRRTEFVYLDLEALTVDGRPVKVTSATLTLETVATRAIDDWIVDTPRWFGQIVSDSRGLDPRNYHSLRARTSVGLTVTGRFLIGGTNSRGIDITGSGGLTLV